MEWLKTKNNRGAVALAELPVVEYSDFHAGLSEVLSDPACHTVLYFPFPVGDGTIFVCGVADDSTGEVLLGGHHYGYYSEGALVSLTPQFPAMHVFEREITERYGVRFEGSTWDKPLRFPHDALRKGLSIRDYPFYSIEGESLHEVTVGPIHAGIIEPGAFRFICNGENILHLEIALGYQHRGVENLITGTDNRLRQTVLVESIAGDTAVGHTTAFAGVVEKLSCGNIYSERLQAERAVALEMERIAMAIADTGALCGDIGYQLGQVACEALRTVVINTLLEWSGNRFGKGLIRPHGSDYPLRSGTTELIRRNLEEVTERYRLVREDIKTSPSILARFEDCGNVDKGIMQQIGGVGMAARASGLGRDIRTTHPWGAFETISPHSVITKTQGDVMARLMVRGREVFASAAHIFKLLGHISDDLSHTPVPDYSIPLMPSSFTFSLVEGWRGEICHAAVTDERGAITTYKAKDPSLHNWLALAMAMRGEGISDFPINNKSFNLSYCGHDL